ncbi:FYVE-type domain-containing protein [Aphelenchoides fujianensis]|nr:FYVE-type domain-containing protein [Aphelenchoides fujianensis]
MAALPEMDDLLDGLEQEVQKELKAKAAEQNETLRSPQSAAASPSNGTESHVPSALNGHSRFSPPPNRRIEEEKPAAASRPPEQTPVLPADVPKPTESPLPADHSADDRRSPVESEAPEPPAQPADAEWPIVNLSDGREVERPVDPPPSLDAPEAADRKEADVDEELEICARQLADLRTEISVDHSEKAEAAIECEEVDRTAAPTEEVPPIPTEEIVEEASELKTEVPEEPQVDEPLEETVRIEATREDETKEDEGEREKPPEEAEDAREHDVQVDETPADPAAQQSEESPTPVVHEQNLAEAPTSPISSASLPDEQPAVADELPPSASDEGGREDEEKEESRSNQSEHLEADEQPAAPSTTVEDGPKEMDEKLSEAKADAKAAAEGPDVLPVETTTAEREDAPSEVPIEVPLEVSIKPPTDAPPAVPTNTPAEAKEQPAFVDTVDHTETERVLAEAERILEEAARQVADQLPDQCAALSPDEEEEEEREMRGEDREQPDGSGDHEPEPEAESSANQQPTEDDELPTDPPASPNRQAEGEGEVAETREERKRSVILSTHAVGNVGTDLRLTESELQLGKAKPIWIRDEDCKRCMICTNKFTIVNRRHHCRCCGRVLCAECCSVRRLLPYMQADEKRQRVCVPCNATLDRIELYEKTIESTRAEQEANGSAAGEPSSSAGDPSAAASSSAQPLAHPSGGSFFVRKKSVLKRSKTEHDEPSAVDAEQSPTSAGASSAVDLAVGSVERRSVKFLDGLRPGDDSLSSPSTPRPSSSSTTTAGTTADQSTTDGGVLTTNRRSSRSNKQTRSSRRTRDMIADEETRTLESRWFYACEDPVEGELRPWDRAEIEERIRDQRPVRLVLRRNLHVILQLIERKGRQFYAAYTSGFNTLGVDELVLVFEKRPADPEGHLPAPLIRSLTRYAETCLRPTTNSLDDRNGIRQCANRMAHLHELQPNETEGHEAVAVLFYPYQNQEMSGIPHPLGIFRIGTFVRSHELPYVQAMPSRFLYRLGMMSGCYPMPVLNELERESAFEPFADLNQLTSSTILTMFHDFRHDSYQLPHLSGGYALITESLTRICIPIWALQQIKRILDSNMNLLAWAMDLSYQADSVLTTERVLNTFATRVFQRAATRLSIGAAFVAFSTGHKGPDSSFTQTLVEDGVVIRLSSDTLETLTKRLASGENFALESERQRVEVSWIEDQILTSNGSLQSPIDGMDLRGYYQYGLLASRAHNANYPFVSFRSKALRLGAVISLLHQRMDPQIQSHFFDACEQLTILLRNSLEQYVGMLLSLDIKWPSGHSNLRRAGAVGYDLAPWIGLEDAYDEFLKLLAEVVSPSIHSFFELNERTVQMLPHLYQLSAAAQMEFRVELHLPIISIRPLSSQLDSINYRNVRIPPPPQSASLPDDEVERFSPREVNAPPIAEQTPRVGSL